MMRASCTGVALALLSLGCAPDGRHEVLEEALAEASPTHLAPPDKQRVPEIKTPHQVHVHGVFSLKGGAGGGQRVEVDRQVLRGPNGAFRIIDRRFWHDHIVTPKGSEDGREVLFDGRELVIRRSWGPWMERETLDGQHLRLLDDAYDVAPAVLAGFEDYIQFREDPQGADKVAGVDVVWERLVLDTQVVPRPLPEEELLRLRNHQDHWRHWLSATHKPNRIDGRLARRLDGDRSVMAGDLLIEGTAEWGGLPAAFTVTLRYTVSELPPGSSFTLPVERQPARRQRPWKMIKDVLKDSLSPVYQP